MSPPLPPTLLTTQKNLPIISNLCAVAMVKPGENVNVSLKGVDEDRIHAGTLCDFIIFVGLLNYDLDSCRYGTGGPVLERPFSCILRLFIFLDLTSISHRCLNQKVCKTALNAITGHRGENRL